MTRGTLTAAVAIVAAAGFAAVTTMTVIDRPYASGAQPIAAAAPTATEAATAAKPAKREPLISRAHILAARAYARSRGSGVSFAVMDGPNSSPRGWHRYTSYPSASVSKAMLMVAVLRHAHGRALTGSETALLKPMITESDNDAASAVYRRVGGAGLRSVARAAQMRRFKDVGWWAGARLTAADQARLFYRIDRLVPARHRAYARHLLSSVVPYQRWGIARVAARRGYRIFFKGGWRRGVNHQIALLEKNGHRFSLAVMTNQSGVAGQRTEEGVAAKIL